MPPLSININSTLFSIFSITQRYQQAQKLSIILFRSHLEIGRRARSREMKIFWNFEIMRRVKRASAD